MSKTSLVVRPRYEPSILEGAMKQFMLAQRRDSLLCKVCLANGRVAFKAPEQPCVRCSPQGQK